MRKKSTFKKRIYLFAALAIALAALNFRNWMPHATPLSPPSTAPEISLSAENKIEKTDQNPIPDKIAKRCPDPKQLCLINQYPHEGLDGDRWSEGLDYYDGYLWHTTKTGLTKLDPRQQMAVVGSWKFDHISHSESPVWLKGKFYHFTYRAPDGKNNALYQLELGNGVAKAKVAGFGKGITNWGSCRDENPLRPDDATSIIYTAEGRGLGDQLFWFDPESKTTFKQQKVEGLSAIEDLGMDRFGTIWTSSFNTHQHNLFFRLDPKSGKILDTVKGPADCKIIDGIAIHSFPAYDILYATGKDCPSIYEYLVPELP